MIVLNLVFLTIKQFSKKLWRSSVKAAAIMQPTFLPWLGYFAMINFVDEFVLYDDVQFSKQSWQSRNRIKTPHGVLTISVPCKTRLFCPINEVLIAPNFSRRKLLATISQSYAKAPFRSVVKNLLEKIFSQNHAKLCDLNVELIYDIISLLDIETKITVASTLSIPRLERATRLVQFCEQLKANQYISPIGSYTYLRQLNPFEDDDINLRFFAFKHPVYPQLHGEFVSHLSAIDAIANIGPAEKKKLIKSSVRKPLKISEI